MLLRIPNDRRSALSLLRGRLPEPKRHDVVELLGAADEVDEHDSLGDDEAGLRDGHEPAAARRVPETTSERPAAPSATPSL